MLALRNSRCYISRALAIRSLSVLARPVLTCAIVAFGVGLGAPPARSQDRQAQRRAAIDQRLKPVRASEKNLNLAPGDTAFLEVAVRVPSARVLSKRLGYEGLVSGIVAPKGVVIHRRVHDLSFIRFGSETEVRFVYALHVEPDAVAGGQARLTVALVERIGLANTVASKSIEHRVRIAPSRPAPSQIAADFYGYRFYRRLAQRRRRGLLRRGVQLSMKDESRLPPLDRAPDKIAAQVLQFARERRLQWVAQRHLVAAMQHPDPETRRVAQAYLQNLDKPRAQWRGVPAISVLSAPPPAPPPPAVTRLEPDSERPAPPTRDPDRPQRLQPSAEYELGTERLAPPPPQPIMPEASTSEPAEPQTELQTAETVNALQEAEDDPNQVVYEDDTFADRPLRRYTRIPNYYRALSLDDPNIAYGAAIRLAFASIETRESADTAAIFYSAQAAFTPAWGIELTVPTQYLSITSFPNDRNPPAQYEIGNPLLALKYRFQLPTVGARRPALTVKARWAIPLAPLHGVPATDLVVEEFTREVNFVDTYAFFLENHDFGLGANLAWRWRWLYTGLQLFGDLFVPVGGGSQNTTFGAISYGASVGALPFGDLVGFFVEGRGTSLLLGGGRHEFFAYAGARGRFLETLEPAIWVAVPLGSIQDASPAQLGLEIRFSYDIEDVLEPRRIKREDDILE